MSKRKKTRQIIATLGPSSLNLSAVQKMEKSGVDIFRINLSHTDLDDFVSIIESVQSWTTKPVCPDTEGAQLRTGRLLRKNNLIVEAHQLIRFTASNSNYDDDYVPLNLESPEKFLFPGDLLKIDFGSVIIQIMESSKTQLLGRVISGGAIKSNIGIGTDRDLKLPSFTEKDEAALRISDRLGLKTIFLSFASRVEDIRKLRSFFSYEIEVIAKIESRAGLDNLDSICSECDAILIDRGDLSRDVPLEKVPFAQSHIQRRAQSFSLPVFVATNLMENMIERSKPTRAEVHDVVKTLEEGASGLVLAAESAVGKYPVECVRVMSRIIDEVDNQKDRDDVDYLLSLPSDRIIDPHGGKLVEQNATRLSSEQLRDLPILTIDERIESDVMQIAQGTYSPLKGFMNSDALKSVLDTNSLNGVPWTLPILFQLKEDVINNIPHSDQILLKSKQTGNLVALLECLKVEKIESIKYILKEWFGTDDINHPGVFQFLSGGEYLLSGEPLLFDDFRSKYTSSYELSPKQTRDIFNQNDWHDIVGFHTRNIPHRGHEFIQKEALEKVNADALFISPVVGVKKSGDFTGEIIIECYEKLIRSDVYKPYQVLLGSFNTYSRYSGPREAVFTAICRKNFGCNSFIVGRDHTGVGNYYNPDASKNMLKELDIGIKILDFDQIHYCNRRKIYTSDFDSDIVSNDKFEISGTIIRDYLRQGVEIPNYLLRSDLLSIIKNYADDKLHDIIYT